MEIKLIETPPWVGGYQMGGPIGITLHLSEMPTRWHKFWVKFFLGWVWIDAK